MLGCIGIVLFCCRVGLFVVRLLCCCVVVLILLLCCGLSDVLWLIVVVLPWCCVDVLLS